MARIKDPGNDSEIQFLEELVDRDGDSLSLDELKLVRVDGEDVPAQDPSWLSHTTQTVNAPDGGKIMEVTARIQVDQLDAQTTYTLKFVGSDNEDEETLFRTVEVG